LQDLLDQNPALIRYRCRVGDWYEHGYFAGATLLQHIAGNPDRGPLPGNIVEITRLLLGRGFDRKDADYTVGLLLTSRRASEAAVALPLIDLLVDGGAKIDWDAPNLLDKPLLNVAPATAAALLKRGAKMQMRHAAALGDLDALEHMIDPAQLEEALAYACIRGQKEAAMLLLQRGARGDVLVTPGGRTPRTALHEAANRGHAEIVKLLLANGAKADVVEPQWGGTAAGWAEHGGHRELAAMLSNAARYR
jgi:ankyrin repeat protein